jgi:hypothetical protein
VPRFTVRARVSSENPTAVRPVLRRLFPEGTLTLTGDPKELVLAGEIDGTSAQDLNRALLTDLRRAERRTRLRAEWSCEGTTERFFDYVPKGKRGPADAVR